MNNVLIKHLLSVNEKGKKYYLNVVSESVYKTFEREYEGLVTSVDVNKFTSKWSITPGAILSYGKSPNHESMSQQEQETFIAILDLVMPKPETKYDEVYGKIKPCYKCWCVDNFPVLVEAGHNHVLDSFACLLVKLHKPEYLIITAESN